MKRILLLLCTLLAIFNSYAQPQTLSDAAKISLITCSPASEIYALFGHTALRVKDPAAQLDVVFNYGIFSFDTPHFYYKFIKGETDYQLGVYDTALFLPEYQERNSSVWEQELNLSYAEKKKLFALLVENYQPENRTYRYNFVFDNCATRPRDKILSALDGYVNFSKTTDAKTFRQWVGTYVGNDTWTMFGIDLLFGMNADRTATLSESMFLPEILMAEIQSATIQRKSGESEKLVNDKQLLVSKTDLTPTLETNIFLSPLSIMIGLLLIGVGCTVWDARLHRHTKCFDFALMLITGFTGTFVLLMSLFSTQPLVHDNLNLLWLNPLNIVLALFIFSRNTMVRKIIFYYQMLNIALLVGALFCFALSIQSFHIATFPLIVLLLVRVTRWFAHTKHILYQH